MTPFMDEGPPATILPRTVFAEDQDPDTTADDDQATAAARRARTLGLLGVTRAPDQAVDEARRAPYPGQKWKHGWVPVGLAGLGRARPGWAAGAWHAEEIDKRDVDRLVKKLLPGLREDFPDKTPAAIEEIARREVAHDLEGRAAKVYRNGPVVVSLDDVAAQEWQAKGLLDVVDELMTVAPMSKVRVRVVSPDRVPGVKDHPGRAAATQPARGLVVLSELALKHKGGDVEHLMPAAGKFPALTYLMYHEWGHLAEKPGEHKDTKRALYLEPLYRPQRSRYAETHYQEAFAEAWAEWHLTRGRTRNLWARVYADKMGWSAK